MVKRMLLFALGLSAVHAHAGRAVIQVDLNARVLRLETFENGTHKKLDIQTLPVVPESFHAGEFTPSDKMYRRFRSANGNVYLENVIYFDGTRSLRTASAAALARRDRAAGAIALDPDIGDIVFTTVHRIGARNTRIIILVNKP